MPKTHTVSWSEISTFRQCPLKHELAYKQRWSRTPDEGSPLSRGTLFHQVLETHYRALQEAATLRKSGQVPAAHEALAIGSDAIADLLAIGSSEQSEEQALVEWMYRGYNDQWGADLEWEIVAVEYANEFWLPTDRGGRSNFKIKMKIDLIVRYVPTGKLWVVDHKSCKNLPSDRMLELDDQFGLYCWGLRELGKPVAGAIHNACRTQRNKTGLQPLDERFSRTMLYRTDRELDTIAVEAYRSARRAWSIPEGQAERAPDSDTCRWKCDFTESCLGARKDRDPQGYLRNSLTLSGFERDRERH